MPSLAVPACSPGGRAPVDGGWPAVAYWLRTHARSSGSRDFSRVAVRQTLGAPDVALVVKSVAMAIASHIQVQGDGMGADAGDMHVCFDERVHPLTESFMVAARKEPRIAVQRLLCQVVSAMVLETECLIVALMLLERALFAEESCLELTLYSWRPCVLAALVVASKTWYDEAISISDFRTVLPDFDLGHIGKLESSFLGALEFNATVSVPMYAKYFFALQDCLGKPSQRRMSAPSSAILAVTEQLKGNKAGHESAVCPQTSF